MKTIMISIGLLLLTSYIRALSILEVESKVLTSNQNISSIQYTKTGIRNVSKAPITLEKKIGQMLMVGFFGTTVQPDSKICKDIKNYNLGGVILFDFNPVNKSKAKNISSKKQLKQLTRELQSCSPNRNLLIAVDQEGGKVQRLKAKYGFNGNFPRASTINKKNKNEVRKIYTRMGKELNNAGINLNLAPVVDLSINPKNVIINKLGRSFGKEPKQVVKYASVFIDAMHKNHVLTSLKHFPGHGSSRGDTHKGFVNVTNNWKELELIPYKILIKKHKIDTIMVAHVFNANLDTKYPASLSYKIVTNKLRKKMGYKGVVITDDLQMGAINKIYGLRKTLKLAINAGDDILLFGNQLNPRNILSIKKLVNEVAILVHKNEVDIDKINKAYSRIQKLKNKYF